MKRAETLTNLSIAVGLLGVLALIAAWLVGPGSALAGMSQQHLFTDAVVLLLIAIWLKLGAIYHK